MKKIAALFLAGFICATLSSEAQADQYDRYERGTGGPPPSRGTSGPPPSRGASGPPPQHARYGQPYFFGHIGVFDPNGDNEGLEFYDSGLSFDVGIGSRVTPVLAVEGSMGSYSTDKQGLAATVVPLTIGFRVIVPSNVFEPYIGGGVGIYFTDIDFPTAVNSAGQAVAVTNSTSSTMGVYGAAGIDAWLNPRMALNFEGKYHWAKPSIGPIDVNVGGWTLNLGIRISF